MGHRILRHGVPKVTPFELVYGQEAVLPVEVNWENWFYNTEKIVFSKNTIERSPTREMTPKESSVTHN